MYNWKKYGFNIFCLFHPQWSVKCSNLRSPHIISAFLSVHPFRFRVSKFNLCILYDAAAGSPSSISPPTPSIFAQWGGENCKFRKIDFLFVFFAVFRLAADRANWCSFFSSAKCMLHLKFHSPRCAISDAPDSDSFLGDSGLDSPAPLRFPSLTFPFSCKKVKSVCSKQAACEAPNTPRICIS